MHEVAFYLIALGGLAYFLLAKRPFDFLTLGFVSACIYFMPGFVGEVLYPLQGREVGGFRVAIAEEAYEIMIFVMAAILATAIFVDLRPARPRPARPSRLNTRFVPQIALTMALVGCVMTWMEVGTEVMTSIDKNLILERLDRWSILWATGATLGFVMAWQRRSVPLMALASLALMLEIYVGFRSSSAMAAMAIAVLWLNREGARRLLLEHWRLVGLGLVLAFAFFAYKLIYIAVKLGDWEYVATVLADPEFYSAAILQSEPFVTQGILNEVVIQQYSVGTDHLLDVIASLLLYSPELGLRLVSFNDMVQPDLFPQITESGIASNIWAQMYSSGGPYLLAGFAILYAVSLAWASKLLRTPNPELRATLATFFAYWTFYIHRNDLLFQVTLEKRVIFFFQLCLLLNVFVEGIARRSAAAGAAA